MSGCKTSLRSFASQIYARFPSDKRACRSTSGVCEPVFGAEHRATSAPMPSPPKGKNTAVWRCTSISKEIAYHQHEVLHTITAEHCISSNRREIHSDEWWDAAQRADEIHAKAWWYTKPSVWIKNPRNFFRGFLVDPTRNCSLSRKMLYGYPWQSGCCMPFVKENQ